jgi:TolB-like protein
VPEKRLIDVKNQVGLWAKYSTYEHYDEHLFNVQDFRIRIEHRK